MNRTRAWVRRLAAGAAVAVLALAPLGVLVTPTPSGAVCPPGVNNGTSELLELQPASRPDRGWTSWLVPRPKDIPTEDPFAKDSKTSILAAYGIGWARYYTYDLGCGGDIRDPYAALDTAVANMEMELATLIPATTVSVGHQVYTADGLGLDTSVVSIAGIMDRSVRTPLAPLAVIATGIMVIWWSRRFDWSKTVTVCVGIGIALTVAYAAVNKTLQVTDTADDAMRGGATSITQSVTGTKDAPEIAAVAPYVHNVLYARWLEGTLGDSDSETARKYGPTLFKARNWSWDEVAQVERECADCDPKKKADKQKDKANDINEGKRNSWKDTAEKIKDEDADAYAYLTGHRATRRADAFVALLSSPVLWFPLGSYVLMACAMLLIRLMTMTAPAWATLAIIPQTQDAMKRAGRVMLACCVHPIVYAGAAALAVVVTSFCLSPANGLGFWGLILALAFTYVMHKVMKPFRRLSDLVAVNPVKAATDGLEGDVNKAKKFAWKTLSTAAGTFAGNKASGQPGKPTVYPGPVPEPYRFTDLPPESTRPPAPPPWVPPELPPGPPAPLGLPAPARAVPRQRALPVGEDVIEGEIVPETRELPTAAPPARHALPAVASDPHPGKPWPMPEPGEIDGWPPPPPPPGPERIARYPQPELGGRVEAPTLAPKDVEDDGVYVLYTPGEGFSVNTAGVATPGRPARGDEDGEA